MKDLFLLLFLSGVFADSALAQRTILAVGAHAGDVELTSGAVLVRQRQLGDRVVILHLTLGERGHPRMKPAEYAVQKRREAEDAAAKIGAEVLFGPYGDGEIPDNEEARRFVAQVIRDVKPTHVITHWRESLHRDHSRTHSIVDEAILLASLQDIELSPLGRTADSSSSFGRTADNATAPPHRGIRGIYFAENWEDAEDFKPYVYVNVSEAEEAWQDAVSAYEFIRGGISSFHYLEYYKALHILRGAEARTGRAVAFDIAPIGKKRILDSLP